MNNGMFNYNMPRFAPYNAPNMQMYNQPQMPQVPVAEMPISFVKFLTADQMKGFVADAGTKVLLIDRQNNIAHLTWADYSGQNYTQAFRYTNYNPEEEKPVIQPILDDKLYVKKEELEDLFKQFNEKIEKLSKQIKISEILEGK